MTEPRTLSQAFADFCECRPRLLALAIFVLVLLLLTGCATFDAPAYWHRVAAPTPVKIVAYADKVLCRGEEVWGCADYAMGVIRISRAAPPSLWACIEEHERTHFEGYTHAAGHQALGGMWCNLTTFQRMPI